MSNIKIIADHYGINPQLDQMQEECAELIVAINKHKRYGKSEQVIEEIADVELMLEQLKYLLNCDGEVQKIKKQKIERQLDRIDWRA